MEMVLRKLKAIALFAFSVIAVSCPYYADHRFQNPLTPYESTTSDTVTFSAISSNFILAFDPGRTYIEGFDAEYSIVW